MKKITLSVDDDVLAAVRRHAAERNSTVNALVREYLTNVCGSSGPGAACAGPPAAIEQRIPSPVGQKTWTREDLHDR
jgi:hypothetical protein